MDMPSTRARRWALSLATPALLLAAGCGDPPASPVYVGRAGDDAALGILEDGGKVTVYLCGGSGSFATLTRWFHGSAGPGGKLSLTSGDATLTGDLTSLKGEIQVGAADPLPWNVGPASATSGLYSSEGACRTGAIFGDIEGDGHVRLQGTWCDGAGRFAQVTPLQPVYSPAEIIDVEVQTAPVQRLQVTRVFSP
jgi:hypothetical protein